jgi:hypothetical protein
MEVARNAAVVAESEHLPDSALAAGKKPVLLMKQAGKKQRFDH